LIIINSSSVASALRDEADNLARRFPRTEPVLLNVQERPDTLKELIDKVDVVISLLPYALHPVSNFLKDQQI